MCLYNSPRYLDAALDAEAHLLREFGPQLGDGPLAAKVRVAKRQQNAHAVHQRVDGGRLDAQRVDLQTNEIFIHCCVFH